jgi:hypothetical protein
VGAAVSVAATVSVLDALRVSEGLTGKVEEGMMTVGDSGTLVEGGVTAEAAGVSAGKSSVGSAAVSVALLQPANQAPADSRRITQDLNRNLIGAYFAA